MYRNAIFVGDACELEGQIVAARSACGINNGTTAPSSHRILFSDISFMGLWPGQIKVIVLDALPEYCDKGEIIFAGEQFESFSQLLAEAGDDKEKQEKVLEDMLQYASNFMDPNEVTPLLLRVYKSGIREGSERKRRQIRAKHNDFIEEMNR